MHFYCINLKTRTDRWEAFSKQPAVKELQASMPFEKFDAVVGASVDVQNDPRISLRSKRNIKDSVRRDHEDLNTTGAIGCYLSHVEIWKKIASNPEPYGVVLEDDAKLPDDFLRKLETGLREMANLEKTPDIWTFSYGWKFYYETRGRELPQNNPANLHGDWVYNTCPGGTAGYCVSKEGAKKLLERAFPIEMHVDWYICMCEEMGQITCVANRGLILRTLVEGILSDIQLPTGCAICNVPTNLEQRGFLVVHMPAAVVGLIAFGALAALKRFAGRR